MVNNIIMKIVYHYQNNLQLGRGIWSLYMGLESFDFWLLIFCSLCKSLETLMEFLFWPLCWAVCLRSMRCLLCLLCLLSPLGRQSKTAQTDKLQNYCPLGQFSILALVQFTIATVVLLQSFNNYCPLAQLRKYRPDLFCKCLNNQRLLMLVLQTACKQPDLVEWEHNA